MTRSAARLLIVTLLLAAIGTGSAVAASPPKRAPKPCKKSEVKRKVTYVKRAGGKEFTFKGCAPRVEPDPATFGAGLIAMLRQSRKSALKLAPKRVVKATRGKAAKRVLAADASSDLALVSWFESRGARTSSARTSGARASEVQFGGDTIVLAGPPGTRSVARRTVSEGDATEARPGSHKTVDIETTGTRIEGQESSKSKSMALTDSTDRCPNAAGLARGEVDFKVKESHVVGNTVIETTTVVNTKFTAQFDEGARIASVEVTGESSWTTETRAGERPLSRRSVSGTVGLDALGADNVGVGRQSERDVRLNFDNIKATDQVMAGEGMLEGLVGNQGTLAADAIAQALLHLQQRAERCMKIEPEPAEVHVKPGGTVALTVRLKDSDGQPRSGPVKPTDGSAGGTVSPKPSAEASPLATFTYYALSTRPPGGIDKVDFRHLSKQGRSGVATVTVIYDEPPRFPLRFEGTWSQTLRFNQTGGPLRPAWTQTVQGTATFVRNPFFETWLDSEGVSVTYDVESASVTWAVSGSESSPPNPGCVVSYTGSGSDPTVTEEWGHARLTLQDVTKIPDAPKPEPEPYYYSIRARGDPLNAPLYTIVRSPECKESNTQEPIVTDYLEIGHPGQWDPETVGDEVEKSNSPALLEGHREREDPGGMDTDQTWHFTGTG